MRMTVYAEPDCVVSVCAALANESRLHLLRELVDADGGSLREVHERTSDATGLSHRETTHTYLEELVDASLVEKRTNGEGRVHYEAAAGEIRLSIGGAD